MGEADRHMAWVNISYEQLMRALDLPPGSLILVDDLGVLGQKIEERFRILVRGPDLPEVLEKAELHYITPRWGTREAIVFRDWGLGGMAGG